MMGRMTWGMMGMAEEMIIEEIGWVGKELGMDASAKLQYRSKSRSTARKFLTARIPWRLLIWASQPGHATGERAVQHMCSSPVKQLLRSCGKVSNTLYHARLTTFLYLSMILSMTHACMRQSLPRVPCLTIQSENNGWLFICMTCAFKESERD